MDLFERLAQNKGPLGQHASIAHGYFAFPKLEGEIGPRMTFRGKKVLNWSLNDYLGLANHPEVRKADAEGAAKFGLAYPMGARMMSGNSNMIEEFEKNLSTFMGKEDTMILNFGYQGIMSVIDAMLSRHDVVVYDSECHACIIDGLKMSFAKRYVYKHNDIVDCEKQLERARKLLEGTNGSMLVITEGVFGMLGDMGKIAEVVALKKKYGFRLLVDDAHGFGTMGKTGAGTAEHQGVQDDVDLYFSTFAKSMASIGAFISGPKIVMDFLRYNTRSQIYAKTLPMPIVYGNLKRLELLRTKPELKDNLWKIVTALQTGLRERGFNLGKTQSCVTPVFVSGGEAEAANLIVDLRENYQIFCSAVIYPVVPKGVIMLRLIPTASHTMDDVRETIAAFEAVSGKLRDGFYAKAGFQAVAAALGAR